MAAAEPCADDLVRGPRARVLFKLLRTTQEMVAGRLRARPRGRVVREDLMPVLERLGAYLWLLGLYDVEPDAEVADALRQDGLLEQVGRPLTYELDDELDDADDPEGWLSRDAREHGPIPEPAAAASQSIDAGLIDQDDDLSDALLELLADDAMQGDEAGLDAGDE